MAQEPTTDAPSAEPAVDPDLVAYLLITAPTVDALDPVAAAVTDLVGTRSIRLLDAAVLDRPHDGAGVRVAPADRCASLSEHLVRPDGAVLLSAHDIELSALTLGPDEAALLLLVEELWAHPIARAARASGGRLSAGERIARECVLQASLAPDGLERGPDAHADLLVRGPGTRPVGDPVEQVHQLAQLVDRRLMSLDLYDVQRRRVLDG